MSEKLTKCLVCDGQIDDHGSEVKFGEKQLVVCSAECAVKFNQNPVKYVKAVLISIILGLTVNPAIADSADEAYRTLVAEKGNLMSKYDATARDVDGLQKQITALKRDRSLEAERAEAELAKALSDKSRQLGDLDFEIRDLDQALKSI